MSMSMARECPFSLKDMVEKGVIEGTPEHYICPHEMRPSLDHIREEAIPLIDVKDLEGPTRPQILKAIASACQQFGFFQIVNHGVESELMADMMEVAREFFALPMEEKLQYFSEELTSPIMFGTSFNINMDTMLNWRDFLRHDCLPLEEAMQVWPTNPSLYRKVTSQFSIEVRKLSLRLLSAIFESLGINNNYIDEAFGKQLQRMVLNYYPPCLNPELAIGIAPHSDYTGISILLQEDTISGLQIRYGDYWVPVRGIKDALVVNLGDQLQIVSNGRYQSVEHRAVLNSTHPRISIVTGYSPSLCTIVKPAPSLIDDMNPPLYKEVVYRDYMNTFKGLHGKRIIDSFKIS